MSVTGTENDEELMLRYQGGDSSAFDLLYSRHSGRVFGYLLKRVNGDREQAGELHQAVFLKFHRSRDRYRPEYPVLQWLFVIAKTVFLDQVRKQGREVDTMDVDYVENIAGPEAPVSQESEVPSLDQLTTEQREVVEARYLREESFSQIATRLGKSEVSIRKTVSRAIQKLKRKGVVHD